MSVDTATKPSLDELTRRLWDIEQIKQLKARYFRLLDTKQWQAWGEVFTEDGELSTTPIVVDDGVLRVARGRDAIRAMPMELLADAVTIHHGHTPEIIVDSPTTARGIWAMFDFIGRPGDLRQGYGHYHEDYQKGDDGEWRIHRCQLVRLRVDRLPL